MSKRIVLDTETYKASSGQQAPRLVCLAWSEGTDGIPQGVANHEGAAQRIEGWLDEGATLVGHGISFDLAVAVEAGVPHHKVWNALESGRVRDTYIHSQMRAIQRGEHKYNPRLKLAKPSFGLAELGADLLHKKRDDKKGPDVWRTRYHELEGVNFRDYPAEARNYVLEDVSDTNRIDLALGDMPPDTQRKIFSQYSLHLTTCHGLRTDPEAVASLEKRLKEEVTAVKKELKTIGIIRPSGSKNMAEIYARVRAAYAKMGLDAPQTEKQARARDAVKTKADEETLRDSKDPVLIQLADISNSDKLLNTYVPYLWQGTTGPVHPRYGLAETGRSTSWGKNIQNQPRKGGVRECYIPRYGKWFLTADFHVAELASLSQILLDMFGYSEMADAIRKGQDLHLLSAALFLGISYEECVRRYKAGDKRVKDTRQLMKALNFGLPGGLGPATFVHYAHASWDVDITFPQASALKDAWLGWWPEARQYFEEIGRRVQLGGGQFTAVQHRSGRLRGGVTYCNGCNTYFQGLTADGARLALIRVAEECYIRTNSPLYGCRPVAFVHDEIILECPADYATARRAAKRLEQVMVESMEVFTPDVPSRADAHLMARWYKGAEPTFNNQGELILWEPKKAA